MMLRQMVVVALLGLGFVGCGDDHDVAHCTFVKDTENRCGEYTGKQIDKAEFHCKGLGGTLAEGLCLNRKPETTCIVTDGNIMPAGNYYNVNANECQLFNKTAGEIEESKTDKVTSKDDKDAEDFDDVCTGKRVYNQRVVCP